VGKIKRRVVEQNETEGQKEKQEKYKIHNYPLVLILKISLRMIFKFLLGVIENIKN
jgi:hypothetical protein